MIRRDCLTAAVLGALMTLGCGRAPTVADAWVLWEKRMIFKGAAETTSWEPLDGSARLADCQKSGQEILKGARGFMESEGRKLLSVRTDGRSAVYESSEGGVSQTIDTRFLCFPGSLDPRTPRT